MKFGIFQMFVCWRNDRRENNPLKRMSVQVEFLLTLMLKVVLHLLCLFWLSYFCVQQHFCQHCKDQSFKKLHNMLTLQSFNSFGHYLHIRVQRRLGTTQMQKFYLKSTHNLTWTRKNNFWWPANWFESDLFQPATRPESAMKVK